MGNIVDRLWKLLRVRKCRSRGFGGEDNFDNIILGLIGGKLQDVSIKWPSKFQDDCICITCGTNS